MALFQLILFVLLALNISTMLSGFMLARRMIAMMIGIVTLVVGLFFPPAPAMFDYLHIIILIDFILVLLGTLMQFGQILPTLMKTMQGGPFHSSHMTNLLVTLFLLLGLVIYYVELAVM
jgi:hypothetical protein